MSVVPDAATDVSDAAPKCAPLILSVAVSPVSTSLALARRPSARLAAVAVAASLTATVSPTVTGPSFRPVMLKVSVLVVLAPFTSTPMKLHTYQQEAH